MTPKEKAKELFEKFKKATTFQYQEYGGAHYSTFEHDESTIKECAHIAVDEILTNAKDTIPILQESAELVCSKEYWLAVKQEIEKL